MTVAWYWHLKAATVPISVVIAISWLIALPEYCLAMPANRIGHLSHGGPFTAPQLKIMQEGIAVTMFLLFSILILKEIPTWRDGVALTMILGGLAVALWK